jgi:uncharacterized protein (DUF58 family)
VQEVRRIEVQTRRLVNGVVAGEYRSIFRGAGVEFDEVREFVEGDDPRSVDWNVTARTGRPFVKKYLDERELSMLFLLDLSPSMDGGFGAWSPRETAARLCACLALSAVQNHDRVGLVAFSDRVVEFVPPRQGLGHALRIVRDCLALPGAAARTDFAGALDLAARLVRRRSVVFLLSDFLAEGWSAPLRRCARRHDVVAVRLLAPELAPPDAPIMRVRDPESGEETQVDWRHAPARAEYSRRVDAWRERTAELLRRADVDRMDVAIPRAPAHEAITRPILEFFRMRELRGSRR